MSSEKEAHEAEAKQDLISGLPPEILLYIWIHLNNLFDLFLFGQVCKRWRLLTGDDRLWERIFAQAFGLKAQRKQEQFRSSSGDLKRLTWREEFFLRMQQTVLRCQITFAIRYNTVPGQIMAVLGNVEALGAWDPKMARRMDYVHTLSENEPNWKLTVSLPVGLARQSLRLEYKYVLVDDETRPLRWESTSRRREIFRGESVYYFRNYWNRMGFEFSSGFRHHYWENRVWSIDICRALTQPVPSS